ncbi:Riboflavin kinase / FMN adenylyltransferase [hydrothermal vent metagenome]|uniref:Bifunctional riboflavin kinase/FMN adenylyltransferase n=1 Tax=hydrothermal vent metagenome TaxID=652676 RepID=A0A1W1BSJ2_9ZZZZ
MGYKNTIKSIAIGSFDGIHYAHKKLIEKADALVIIERNSGYLTSGFKRSYFTDKACYFYHFLVIKSLTPKQFVAKLHEDFPLLEKIVVGYDFHFGKDKAGDAKMLARLCEKEVLVIDEVKLEGVSVHSRTIKTYLIEGNILMANRLLARKYTIEGQVICGQGLGAKSLMPTLNLNILEYQLPASGVYATLTTVKDKVYDSVSFLGHRVSTDGSYAVETHILDKNLGICTGFVSITFVDFIRKNQKFESLEALKEQIHKDISKSKEVLDAQR